MSIGKTDNMINTPQLCCDELKKLIKQIRSQKSKAHKNHTGHKGTKWYLNKIEILHSLLAHACPTCTERINHHIDNFNRELASFDNIIVNDAESQSGIIQVDDEPVIDSTESCIRQMTELADEICVEIQCESDHAHSVAQTEIDRLMADINRFNDHTKRCDDYAASIKEAIEDLTAKARSISEADQKALEKLRSLYECIDEESDIAEQNRDNLESQLKSLESEVNLSDLKHEWNQAHKYIMKNIYPSRKLMLDMMKSTNPDYNQIVRMVKWIYAQLTLCIGFDNFENDYGIIPTPILHYVRDLWINVINSDLWRETQLQHNLSPTESHNAPKKVKNIKGGYRFEGSCRDKIYKS